MNRPIITYLRVSTKEQGNSELGLQAQEEAIRKFAEANDLQIVGSYTDIASGSKDAEHRPGLEAALKEAKRLKASIAVSKLDRLSRSVAFISTMMTRQVPFIACNLGLDVDSFMLHIYAALAEKERKMIGERTKEALAILKSQGKQLGSPKIQELNKAKKEEADSKAKEIATENAALLRMLHKRGDSLRTIADRLNADGILSHTGSTWCAMSVRKGLQALGLSTDRRVSRTLNDSTTDLAMAAKQQAKRLRYTK